MARGFEEKKIVLTENQENLRRCEGRLYSLKTNHPDSNEVARYEMIRTDIMSRMDEAEQAAYKKLMTAELTPAEKKVAAEKLRVEMEANRDKPSI